MRQISTTVEVSQQLVKTAGRFADVFALLGTERSLRLFRPSPQSK